MKKKNKILIGNWKMNPENLSEALSITKSVILAQKNAPKVDVVACPPYVFLESVGKKIKGKASLGAQDISKEFKGSFTGQVSGAMLTSFGVEYVIIGHSERRLLGETNELISEKASVAFSSGLIVVLCVGEKERDSHGDYLSFIKDQILITLSKKSKSDLMNLVIAYEPVWAIGKSFADAMKPHDIHEMSLYIRKVLADAFTKEDAFRVPILYGGSVSTENAGEIVRTGEVQGLLVGRQSLDGESFKSIALTLNGI